MVKGCKDLANKYVLANKETFEDEWKNAIPYYDVNGMTVQGELFPR